MTPPDFYVTEAGAAELSGVHAADLGVNVGRVEDRACRPVVADASTPAACTVYARGGATCAAPDGRRLRTRRRTSKQAGRPC